MEKAAYVILIIATICWLIAMVAGMIAAFPFGMIGLVVIIGFGLLFVKVLRERLSSRKDDRYSKDVEKQDGKMLLTTQDELSGYEITETLGIVRGNTVRARHAGKDILAGFRNIVGGEIGEYTKLLAESREQAVDRMIENAKNKDADGIVCIRFTTSSIMQAAAELFVFGTAVKLEKKA